MDHQAAAERFENFVENVHLVHYHNRRSDVLHRIALNQFSDRHPNEMPLYPINSDRDSLQDVLPKDVLVNLSSRNGITSALLELETRRRLHHGDKKKKHHKGHHKKVKMDIDPQDRWAALESASGAGTMEGRQVRIKARESDIDQILDVGDDDAGESLVDDNFEKYLNWATRDNPDGVSIVHPASDQGACGSCWAFAATGTLEASLSRRFAFETYTNQVIALENSTESEIEQVARDAELEAITLANLSVQELVDCDTSADQGCVGGNPLLAFFFIHRYGLTSAKNYPYVGEQQLCRVRKVAEPIATSKSWGILTSNHEDNMELVLRWIGPVAVGVDGSDPTFLAYKSGIYDSQTCGQDANHALLIVGYGEEEQEDGSLQRFWIARNSWGESWGENGYVKVKRGNGQLDLPGVCGIAKNPSVALGGVLLPNSGIKNTSIRGQGVEADRTTERLEESLLSNYCDALGLGDLHTCHTVQG
jgi:KDEL-tailed cysteine endopeptidase